MGEDPKVITCGRARGNPVFKSGRLGGIAGIAEERLEPSNHMGGEERRGEAGSTCRELWQPPSSKSTKLRKLKAEARTCPDSYLRLLEKVTCPSVSGSPTP